MCKICGNVSFSVGVTPLDNIWNQIKERLSGTLTSEAYQNWIARTQLEDVKDGLLIVRVPDETAREWIEQEYTPHIWSAVRELRLPVRRLEYSLGWVNGSNGTDGHDHPDHSRPLQRIDGASLGSIEPMFENPASWLNPRLTF